MNAFRRRYGESPLQLLLLLASFALAGYAGVRLLKGDTFRVIVWFVGAAVLHDLVLLPLYSSLDRALQGVTRRGGSAEAGADGRSAVNHVRVPAFLSLLLLLVWFPLVLRLTGDYTAATGLSADHFWEHWLLIAAALFAASAAFYVARLVRGRPRAANAPEAEQPDEEG